MKNTYESPLTSRYASKEMQALFSPDKKFKTWRRLWVALAEAEMELGLDISQDQVDELKSYQDDINHKNSQPNRTRLYKGRNQDQNSYQPVVYSLVLKSVLTDCCSKSSCDIPKTRAVVAEVVAMASKYRM